MRTIELTFLWLRASSSVACLAVKLLPLPSKSSASVFMGQAASWRLVQVPAMSRILSATLKLPTFSHCPMKRPRWCPLRCW